MEKYYLDDNEVEKVKQFNDDDVMREAVKKVLLERIYHSGILEKGKPANDKNWAFNLGGLNDFAMDDEKVGNMLKTTTRGLALVEDAFSEIANFTNKKDLDPEGGVDNNAV